MYRSVVMIVWKLIESEFTSYHFFAAGDVFVLRSVFCSFITYALNLNVWLLLRQKGYHFFFAVNGVLFSLLMYIFCYVFLSQLNFKLHPIFKNKIK